MLAEFDVAKDGDVLILPVTIDGKEHRFALGTSGDSTIFDTRFRPRFGDIIKAVGVTVPNGILAVSGYERGEAPNPMLGPLPVELQKAGCLDLSFGRQFFGDIDGILSMDFLAKHIVRIDFDAGKLQFLSAVPPDSGTPLRIRFDRNGKPLVMATLPDVAPRWFSINTFSSFGVGLDRELFDQLTRNGANRLYRSASKHPTGRLSELNFGEQRLRELDVSITDKNVLGLKFLSRFVLTMDFPGETLYLRPGANHDRVGSPVPCGLVLDLLDAGWQVVGVESDSGAEAAGIRIGDVLLEIDGRKFESMRMNRRLYGEGNVVPVTLRRGEELIRTTIEIKEYRTFVELPAGGGPRLKPPVFE